MATPIRALELHHPMVQFIIIFVSQSYFMVFYFVLDMHIVIYDQICLLTTRKKLNY